jgi:hypothetical protein
MKMIKNKAGKAWTSCSITTDVKAKLYELSVALGSEYQPMQIQFVLDKIITDAYNEIVKK